MLKKFFAFSARFWFILCLFVLRWPCNRCRLRVENVLQRESPQRSIQSGRCPEPTAERRRPDYHDQQGDPAVCLLFRNEPRCFYPGQKCSRCWYFSSWNQQIIKRMWKDTWANSISKDVWDYFISFQMYIRQVMIVEFYRHPLFVPTGNRRS